MATVYVNSGAAGAGTGADWTNAFTTVTAALSGRASGDIIYVHKTHSVTAGAAITWTLINGNLSIICVDKDASDAWSTGAVEKVGTFNGIFTIAQVSTSSLFVYGMTIGGATGNQGNGNTIIGAAAGANGGTIEFNTCTFTMESTNTSSGQIRLGGAAQADSRGLVIDFNDCTFNLPNHAGSAGIIGMGQCRVHITNPTIGFFGASKPTVLFFARDDSSAPGDLTVSGDLSGFNSTSGVLVGVGNFGAGSMLFKGCKLSTSTTSITSGTWPGNASSITLRNVDSGDTLTTFEYRNRLGTLTEDTATYAASGASFNSTPVSWQIVTTAACDEYNPFVAPLLSIWNTSTSAQTATVETLWDSATGLKDTEIWLEIAYLSSASFPLYTVADDRNATPFVSSGTAQATSAVTWTEALTNDNEQYVSVAFTAADVGIVEGHVYVARASTTLYIDPLLRLA